ncbi:MAG: N-6 DNA methylase [Sulfurimonadaceae bacterium]|nr:N-6 DNA methylase [Sulfurimonadaceae bacterium]
MDIKKFLESQYSYENFKKFIFDKFYGFEENNIDYEEPDTNIEQKHILKYKFMGSCQLDDKKEIGFFEVITTEKTDIENNRVSLGNILKNKASNELLDSAIAVFYNPNNPSVWRLSFIKFSYDENDKKEVSNLKRFTYVLGKNIPIKTAYNQLKNLKYPSLIELEEAFSVDKVTKEFYAGLVTLYNDFLETYLKYPNRSEQYENSKKEFAIRLIGRLLFIKFLNKKSLVPNSIFTVEKDYYNEVLEPLFFEKLNTPKKDRKPEFKDEQIPFLNGGLFEPLGLDFYDYKGMSNFYRGDLIISDKFFEEFYSHLANYNFTIDENSLDDSELSIDPEMLGRIFENLLAEINPETKENARKSTGSFYTPREIVDYMVSSSIYEYLKDKTNIEENILKTIVFKNEEPKNDYDKTKILSALFELKILDPACGSGAFPMGILQKMMKILSLIDEDATIWFKLQSKAFIEENSGKNINYLRKLKIIKDSIFGVDIQPSAIEISKLRFFLSLIVDEDGEPEPLPNLEFKFVCANTLLPSPFNIKKNTQTTIFDNTDNINSIYEKIKFLKERYFYSSSKDKESIKKEYKNIQKELFDEFVALGGGNLVLVDYNPFDPLSVAQFYDSEFMFNIKDGFDIVIGNPPYIKEYTNKSAFDGTRNSECYQGKMDIWYLFGCKAIELLKENGILSYIATNNWISNSGASKFRNKILTATKIIEFIDFGDYKVFETAGIQTMILISKKTNNISRYYCNYSKIINKNIEKKDLNSFLYKKEDKRFSVFESSVNPKELIDQNITFLESKIFKILDRIEANKNFEITDKEISQGITPNPDIVNSRNIEKIPSSKLLEFNIKVGDGVFVLKKEYFNELSNEEQKYIKPLYEPENISKYTILNYQKEILYLPRKVKLDKESTLYKHLSKFREIMDDRRENINGQLEFYNLHWSKEKRFFEHGEKVLSLRKCPKSPIFSYTEEECYVMLSFNIIKSERINLKYLTALLNSKLVAFWLKYKGKMQGDNYQVDKEPILNIPIKNIEDTKPFEILVDYIIYLKKEKKENYIIEFFERVIDIAVYELYFKEELHSKGFGILEVLESELIPFDNSFETIERVYKKLSDKNHKVAYNVNFIDTLDIVKTIENK